MNDPGPWRTAFSDMARTTASQDAFFQSLIAFLALHDFDGVDLDWEVRGPYSTLVAGYTDGRLADIS